MRNGFLLILSLLFVSVSASAQVTPIRPGILYHAGELLQAPTYGFTARIPDGWSGMLPQGTELFMLMKEDGTNGMVVMAARSNSDFGTLRTAWQQGADLTEAIKLHSVSDITENDGLLQAEVVAEGERVNKGYRGYIVAKCSEFGPCVSLLMITPGQYFDGIKSEMLNFMQQSSFVEPQQVSPYANFDWQRFLANKMLVVHQVDVSGKRENILELCVDGTFSANVKRTGWLRDDAGRYLGKHRGRWSVTGTGPQTLLTLEFEKKGLEPLKVPLKIEDEKIYANDIRHYAGYSQKCD